MTAYANPPTIFEKTLKWSEKPLVHAVEGSEIFEIWKFEDAVYSDEHPSLPYISDRFPIAGFGQISVTLLDVEYESFDKNLSVDDAVLL